MATRVKAGISKKNIAKKLSKRGFFCNFVT